MGFISPGSKNAVSDLLKRIQNICPSGFMISWFQSPTLAVLLSEFEADSAKATTYTTKIRSQSTWLIVIAKMKRIHPWRVFNGM
jgi:hypothetical protein